MARSPLTLAAAVTSALPRVGVVAAGPLTAGGSGRCDSAVVTLDDGREVVVRAPADADAARDLAAEALALRALTSGVRRLLAVRAPELLGEVALGEGRALVVDLLPGYQVEAAHLPGGPGAAVSVGRALASVHALPASVVRSEGLRVRTPAQVRDETVTLLDRAEATDRVPPTLMLRWRQAVAKDDLWRFESTVVLGGAAATSFLFQDTEAGPTATGVLDWHGLAVGDPAIDLRWLASAPQAADDVLTAYHDSAHRAPDAHLRTRARLYAELEFAQWLVHGSDVHRADIMDDAAGLLETLADSVRGDDLVPAETGEPLDDAIAILDRVPQAQAAVDTSMQTDAYDPAELGAYLEDQLEQESAATGAESDDTSTAPIDLVTWVDAHVAGADDPVTAARTQTADDEDSDLTAETERASREALRRWAASE